MTKIIQFGTSRFLQAHVDLFVSEAMKTDESVGEITIVKTTNHNIRSDRLAALSAKGGFPIKIKGLENGVKIDKTIVVTSVTQSLTTENDWPQLLDIFVNKAEIILSNSGDTGFDVGFDDEQNTFSQSMSYPAKLNQLLKARYAANGRGIQIMPMELISNNGSVLKARILEIARNEDEKYLHYLNEKIVWVNSLVDRIVSEPIEPAGAVAEPYSLWAIEQQDGLVLPCNHYAIKVVDNLKQVEVSKLFILNLGHTYLAHRWLKAGKPKNVTVLDMMNDGENLVRLSNLYKSEILPAFVKAGLKQPAMQYIDITIERYSNPFLNHLVADIAQNHANKVGRRMVAFIEWAENNGDFTRKPILQHVVDFIK